MASIVNFVVRNGIGRVVYTSDTADLAVRFAEANERNLGRLTVHRERQVVRIESRQVWPPAGAVEAARDSRIPPDEAVAVLHA